MLTEEQAETMLSTG